MKKKRMYVVPEIQIIVLNECLLATVSGEDPTLDFARRSLNVGAELSDDVDEIEWEE